MSRQPAEVPFVVGSDGTVYLNVINMLVGTPAPDELLARACVERGRLLVAVELDGRETRDLLRRLHHGATETAAFAAGARARRRRRRQR